MKVFMSMILILSLMLCLWGCGGQVEPTVPTSETVAATEGAAVVRGTVLAITDTTLTVQTEKGEEAFSLTDGTLCYRDFGRGGFRPDAGMPNEGQQPPEPPADGQFLGSGEPPQLPADGQQPPEPPTDSEVPTEGEASTSGGFILGNGNQGGSAPPDNPEGDGSFDPGSRPDRMEPQTITHEEIAVGDTVSLILDENGTVLTLTVEGGQPPVPPVTEGTSQQ